MTAYTLGSLLYEGKAKRVYQTDQTDLVAVEYKDDATAFNAVKKAQLAGKGLMNCQISARLFELLEREGIATHYLSLQEPNWMLVKPVQIVPVEVVVRNIAFGSLCKQMPIEPGTPLDPPLLDLYYKDDAYGDPLLTDARLERLGVLTAPQRQELERLAMAVNTALRRFFAEIALELVDFKIELGFTTDGQLVVADEISPDFAALDRNVSGDAQERILDKTVSARISAVWSRPTGRFSNGSKPPVQPPVQASKFGGICGSPLQSPFHGCTPQRQEPRLEPGVGADAAFGGWGWSGVGAGGQPRT